MIKYMVNQASARAQGHEFGLKADQATRRDDIIKAHTVAAIGETISLRSALRLPSASMICALVLFFDIDSELLIGLAIDAIDFSDDDLRA